MSTRPLLIFPQPERAPRKKKTGGPSDFHFPSHRRQVERLAPKFDTLRRTFETQRAQLRLDPGLEPERVLVLETVDGVDDFVKAVRRTPGMEWLGEWDEETIESDEDFYEQSHPEEPVRGRLYLVMLNQTALHELLSLWNRYRRNPREQFARGLNKWRNIFVRLHDIRPWNERDRLDPNLARLWQEELSARGRENLHFKVELWFSGSDDKRRSNQAVVERLVREQGGRILAQAIIPEIAFHAVAGVLPSQAARRLIELQETRLVLCDQIMFFRPLGQSAVAYPEDEPVSRPATERVPRRPERLEPVVALLDGLPAVNHELLTGRIVLDDPDGWSQQYTAPDPVHGTMMASLIAHGDLSANERAIPTPIYARPIFTPDRRNWRPTPVECIPENVIPEDLIQRAIVRMFSTEAGGAPIAPSVRIVTLAIGDPFVLFERTVSPLAKLLDWLAWKYKVLFLVSAGNRVEDIQLANPRGTLGTLTPPQLEDATLRAIELDGFNRRLLCPAEAINALTAGATHSDFSTIGPLASRINPFSSPDLPSPISALGLGYRRSVKPDLLLPGGRQLFGQKLGNTHERETLQVLKVTSRAPGNLAAAPGRAGNLSATRFYCGTSNSTAMAARRAVEMYELLRMLRSEPGGEILNERYTAVILKTMLVHGCSWDGPLPIIKPILQSLSNRPPLRDYVPRFLGYGPCRPERIFGCPPERATLIGCGELTDGDAHIYHIPLPPSLSGRRTWRKLTVTLSWLSPINPLDRYYRRAALWFAPPENELLISRSQVDWQMAQRGTVQHEILEGDQATAYVDGKTIQLQVNCRAQTGKLEEAIPYAIAVSLEVAAGTAIPIYEEVRARIRVPVHIRASRPHS